MNEYQEAYSYIKHYCELDDDCVKWPLYQRSIKSLKELVDKATPKKPIKLKLDYMEAYVCPNCRHTYEGSSYCRHCGQALGWSENEKS